MKNKTVLIPGWMNGGGIYKENNNLYEVLEVWKERIHPKNNLDVDYLIGHSLGCNWALLNWKKNKNYKLILVNPLLPKRNISSWISRWKKFSKEEKIPYEKEALKGIKRWLFGIKLCFKLLRYDFDQLLNEIPKENIFILCGEEDFFYCDEKFKEYVKMKNITLVEIKKVGHDWKNEINKEIKKIISSS